MINSTKVTVSKKGSPLSREVKSSALIYQGERNKTNNLDKLLMWLYSVTVIIGLCATSLIAQTIVVTNPASPFTVPGGVTSIQVEVWGGGGGGGGILTTLAGNKGGGGGGGGGAYNTATFTVTSGQTYTNTKGAGGASGPAALGGGSGGTSTVTGPGGTISASGGGGGGGATGGNGSSGSGAGGLFNGGAGGASGGNGAGGGGGAGNNGSGTAGANAGTGTGGVGNPNVAPYVGGNGGAFTTANANGNAGITPAGGGGGGRSTGILSGHSGGAGAAGQVVITYTIPPPCSGTPAGGTTLSSANSVCPGINFTLSLTGNTSSVGITYQWQSSPDNVTYTNIGGATAQTLTTSQNSSTYYRCSITCGNGGLSSNSTVKQVTMNSFLVCYCAPTHANGSGCNLGGLVDGLYGVLSNVTFNTLNNSTGCPGNPYYNLYPASGSTTTSVTQGSAYTLSVTSYYNNNVSAWIDWNQDGVFASSEWYNLGSNSSITTWTGTQNITVPVGPIGQTRIRIRSEIYSNTNNASSACAAFTYGETEDYVINVLPQICINNPLGPSNASAMCPSSSTQLSWPALYNATGYDVYFDVVNPPVTVVSTNQVATTFNTGPLTGGTNYYWSVLPHLPSGGATTCSAWSFVTNAVPVPLAGSNAPVCNGFSLSLSCSNQATGQATGNTYGWSGPSFSSSQQNPPVTSAANAGNSGTYNVTITNQFGCTATASTIAAVNDNPQGTATATGVSCVGLCDGGVLITPTAGQSPFIYTDGVSVNTDGIFTNAFCEGSASVDVFDDNGCTVNIPFSIGHISTVPVALNVPFPTVPAYACNGNSFTANTNPVNLATTYTWDGPSGTTFNTGGNPYASSIPSVTVNYGPPNGSGYNICVQAGNGCGSTNRRCSFVRGTVNVPGAITPVNNRVVECANTTADYSISPVNGATSYTWSITGDASITGSGTNITISFGAGWTNGILSVRANTPCFTSVPRNLVLSSTTAAPGTISGSSSACPGSSVIYSISPSGGVATYNWVLPANTSGSSGSNSINVNFLPGFAQGDIKISLTSICGNTSAQKIKTVASSLPAVPSNLSGSSSGLCGQTVTYNCPSVSGAVSYTWTIPGTVNSGQGSTSINATYGTFTSGNVCVKADNSCGSGAQRCIPVIGKPVAPAVITYSPNPICANASGIDLQVNPVFGTAGYTWTFPSGVSPVLDLDNEQIVNWGSSGGTVTVTVNNACGNSSKNQLISLGCREAEKDITIENNSMVVYPNPAHDNINISFSAAHATYYTINLLDLSGRVLFSQSNPALKGINNSTINLSRVAKGIYIIELKSGELNKQVRTVVN